MPFRMGGWIFGLKRLVASNGTDRNQNGRRYAMNQQLLDILRSEIKPALGCTGPIGICFCAAQAYDAIGGNIRRIDADIDWGLCSKVDDVAFPGTEMLGVEMAIALGALGGDPGAGLEVLHAVTPETEMKAREAARLVRLHPQWERTDLGMYVKITIETDRGVGVAEIQNRSDGLTLKMRNGEVLERHEPDPSAQSHRDPVLKFRLRDFYEFAVHTPVDRLDFLLDAAEYNTRLAQATLEGRLGAGIGVTLYEKAGNNSLIRAKAYAAAGCEARMSGVKYPAMSCANKGNVGIAASMPLVSVARDRGLSEEKLQRALALSYLVAIAVIRRIGKCPSMCSCEVAASLGVAAGNVLLHEGTEEQVEIAIQNTIPNIFGVVCDGAKLACALRISSGTGIALETSSLALQGVRLANNQGVLAENADASLELLGKTALFSMVDSDRSLSRRLFEKRSPFPLMTFAARQRQ